MENMNFPIKRQTIYISSLDKNLRHRHISMNKEVIVPGEDALPLCIRGHRKYILP